MASLSGHPLFCRCNWPTSNFVNSIADSPTTSRRDFPKIWHQFGILYKAAPRRLQLCSCQKKHILCMHMQYTPRESCMHVHGTVYDNWWCWRSYACCDVYQKAICWMQLTPIPCKLGHFLFAYAISIPHCYLYIYIVIMKEFHIESHARAHMLCTPLISIIYMCMCVYACVHVSML